MKNLLLFIFCGLFSLSVFAKKYALIIAVGDYPKKTGWRSISSVNDVPLIKQALLGQGFEEKNITVLTDSKATKKGILKAFQNLKSQLKEGDIVVVHYSGHGQQIFDDNGDEIDDLDEAIVPVDANVRYSDKYKGENHIRDDELGNIINNFRNVLGKSGQLLFLLDSCHSGSASRGGVARGGEAVFAPPSWKPSQKGKPKGSDMVEKTKLSKNAAPFVIISGSSASELNYEYEGTGSLSYAFNKSMSELGSNFTYRQLYNKIASTMNVIAPQQTPVIEGDQDYKLFKGEYVKQEPYFEVIQAPTLSVVKIQAGKLQGIFEHTTVNILPAGTIKFSKEKVISKGEVVKAKFNEANIRLENPLPDGNTKKYWVFVDQKAYGDLNLTVYVDPQTIQDPALKNEINTYLTENKLGLVTENQAESKITITKRDENYLLNSTNGVMELADIKTGRGDVAAVRELEEKLFNFAQGQYLKNLHMDNADFEFSFRLLPVSYDVATEEVGGMLPEDSFVNDKGMFAVRPGLDHVVLEVTNKSDQPIYFSIIEINSKGEVNPFLPNGNCNLSDDDRKLAPGKTKILNICIFSFGPPYEKLMLKGFASSSPINFQPTISSRGEGNRGPQNPLETFIGNTYEQTRSGEGNKVSGAIDGYSTEFMYEIVKE